MKLLVAVSDKPLDPAALESLGKLADSDPAIVLHVGDAAPQAVLDAQAALERGGARVTRIVSAGDPAKAIVDRARTEKADLVVVRGHDRHPGLLRRVFGNTVEKVVETCDRPVLALRGITSPEGRHILLAGGRPSSRMLDVTAEIAKATDSRVTLVHVDPAEDTVFASGHQQVQQQTGAPWLTSTLDSLRRRGAEADLVEREGLVERELTLEANSGQYWLTIVRARPVGFLHRLVLGHSFTEDLVRHVGTSVLLLR
ncbi:MAG: Universal stress protein family [Thermoplasmata archaeon]|jgi:nucleotide-binding universal stress UspA family protein|nr:Universal stress protein family [Thermoplasmata archaeon]